MYSIVYSLTCNTCLLDQGSLWRVRDPIQYSHFHEETLSLECLTFPAKPVDLPDLRNSGRKSGADGPCTLVLGSWDWGTGWGGAINK